MKIKVKKLYEDAIIPQYQHPTDACFDLHSQQTVMIWPGQYKTVGTGIAYEIPEGYVGNIRPRSGLASKFAVRANSSGVIDSGYRGEVMCTLINLGDQLFTINKGDRIAQMMIHKVEHIEFETTEDLSNTQRGAGGHGSTGV